jgi:hydroxymethylpyrimidine/phosphomethylpyrimidine kinase
LPGDTVIDLLITQAGEKLWMQAPRIHSPNTHGTGCTLSSAMAAHLALGATLADAVQQARIFVREALQAGAQVRTGQGSGPLNHGFGPLAMRLKALG